MSLQSTPSESTVSQFAVFSDGNTTQSIATVAEATPSVDASALQPATADGIAHFMTLCFLAAWAIALLVFIESALRYSKKAGGKPCSQIPCSNCLFFSNNPHLRCAVHPSKALTKNAINCTDYSFNPNPKNVGKKQYHQF
jgi:hypothetical protein